MAHINKCIEDLLRKSKIELNVNNNMTQSDSCVNLFSGGKKRSEQHAAVWVPDNEAVVCMCCKKTQFTMLIRRHHCR